MKKLYFKKFTLLIVTAIFFVSLVFLSSCKEENYLLPFVSETRTDIFLSENEKFPVKAYYGKKDGQNFLTFFISGGEIDETSLFLEMQLNDETVKKEFTFDPVKSVLTLSIPIDNFTEKEFTVNILKGSDKEELKLSSILPEKTLPINEILNALCEKQSSLIKNYMEDGVFNGNICARIIVKDNNAYWYIGLTDKSGKLTAFLMDAKDGTVKAVREIL